jgi:hypothetical protein
MSGALVTNNMTHIARQGAFDRPFKIRVFGNEIILTSEQAPIELALTAAAAREVGRRLVDAADQIDPKRCASERPAPKPTS